MKTGRWKHYLPAAFLLILGWAFLAVPALAVFIVSGSLFFLGTFYAVVVYKMHRTQDQSWSNAGPVGQNDFWSTEPNFRNVTVHFVRRADWFKA